ncbi:DUF167 family protein [Jiella sonneratiae]|uniref:DUF167 family protein n=1 Tax=Jiella sonneratiae TaxID=2816856 RepID=UPI0024787E4E|nr:DUF167 family protein [Jiella sonneratiae]
MDETSYRFDGDGLLLFVRVTPRSAKDMVDGRVADAEGRTRLLVRVRAVPEDGKANAAVVALVAKTCGLPKSAVAVVAGLTQRQKTLRLAVSRDRLADILGRLGIGPDRTEAAIGEDA